MANWDYAGNIDRAGRSVLCYLYGAAVVVAGLLALWVELK